MRCENKFVLPDSSLQAACNEILTSHFFFCEIFDERRINNIYLDTVTLDNLKDNLNGVPNRIKHRIRWYGDDTNVKAPILEYKIKKGLVGYKEYYALPGFKFDGKYDYDGYLEEIEKSKKTQTSNHKIMYREIYEEIPTLFNTYLRRYFLSGDGKYRITLDRNITYKGISKKFDNAFSFSENKTVLELKYENEDMEGAPRIIQDLRLRVTRNSKYVIGMRGIYFNDFDID